MNKRGKVISLTVIISLVIVTILAIGGVAGMAFYNGNSGGDDGFNTFIPTSNDTGGLFSDDVSNDPTQAKMEENATNKTENQTNDTNKSKTLTENVTNKTNQTVKKTNDTNTNKTLSEKIENKTLYFLKIGDLTIFSLENGEARLAFQKTE